MKQMRSSLFCPVLPGDSASARRTSEIFMSGCIPIFMGPPYGSMPFPDEVDYKHASLIFNITEHRCSSFQGVRALARRLVTPEDLLLLYGFMGLAQRTFSGNLLPNTRLSWSLLPSMVISGIILSTSQWMSSLTMPVRRHELCRANMSAQSCELVAAGSG